MYKKYAKRPLRTRRPKSTKKPKVSTAIRAYVKRTIAVKLENKISQTTGLNVNIGTTVLAAPYYQNLLPLLGHGTVVSGRVGNRINVKSGTLTTMLSLKEFNATSNPYMGPVTVKLWIIKCRVANSNALLNASPNIATDFLDNTSASAGLQGNLFDCLFRVNPEKYKVMASKTITLGGNSIGPPGSGPYTPFISDNHSGVATVTFNLTKHIKKFLIYDDSATTCTNDNLFLIVQPVLSSGRDSTNYTMVNHTFASTVQYEDA